MAEEGSLFGFDGGAWQREVYERVAAGEAPPVPMTFDALESAARGAVADDAFGFVSTGAGTGATTAENVRAFDEWRISPRVLRDVSERDLAVDLLGTTLPAPLAFAPIGGQRTVHDDGEVGSARAAATLGLPFAVSSASSRSMEAIAEEMGDAPRWFQLYVSAEPVLTESFVERAGAAGYDAVVVTVDNPVRGWRPLEVEAGFSAVSGALHRGNYFTDPVFRERLDRPPEEAPDEAVTEYRDLVTTANSTWDDLEGVCEASDLPVLAKGIQRPADAERALARGVDGVVVSNHGGNHLDAAVAALDALPAVAEAVGDRCPVLFDSGVRTGADAFVALALGADAVCVGRPYLYGLAVGGEAGARAVMTNLAAEFDLTMAVAGRTSPADVDRSDVVRRASGEGR